MNDELNETDITTPVEIRRGDAADLDAVLSMLDASVVWLTERGRSGQWGTELWSSDPAKVERVHALIDEGDLWIATIGQQVVGALIINEQPMPYIEAADEPELYVRLLVTSPLVRGQGVGSRLLEIAREQARQRGIGLLRVDCWAGGDGKLVSYYQSQGFTPVRSFDVNGWTGQLLSQRIM